MTGLSLDERLVWVVHRRPCVSAIRWLNLGVSFPAVSSHGRPALADPISDIHCLYLAASKRLSQLDARLPRRSACPLHGPP